MENLRLGYSNVTCQELLQHLWTTYGTIPQQELDANTSRMNAPWHPPTPIESLWMQLDHGSTFAAAAGEPIPVSMVIRTGYNLLFATGLFDIACREWSLTPPATVTLASFKNHFLQADLYRRQLLTTRSAGYHGANLVTTPPLLCSATQSAITAAVTAALANHVAASSPSASIPFLGAS